MALAKAQSQITWSTSDTVSVGSSSSDTSDEQSISDDAVAGELTVKADNAGTPASGDVLDVKILYNNGDPDADPDSADEFDTSANARVVRKLDTNSEDPVIVSIPIRISAKSFKVFVENQASSNSITASAQYNEQTFT